MKNISSIILVMLFFASTLFASDKKVIVEIFTNSDCGACVAAHSTLNNYLQGINGDKIEFVYYHVEWPSPLDKLYTHNVGDSKNKNSFYGPYFSSPQAFFNGVHVENSYTQWAGLLDELGANQSDFQIQLSGSRKSASFTINAEVTKVAENNYSDLTINFVIVEDVFYAGVNGITDHKHVMRKIRNPQGTLFNVAFNETELLSAIFPFNTAWNNDNLKIIAFVQNQSTKEIYQTASIDYSSLILTDISSVFSAPTNFNLEQNYPNPFNPTTTIKYSIPNVATDLPAGQASLSQRVTIKVYDVLGREVQELVNKNQAPGNYEISFDASILNSGVYYYQINYNGLLRTNKMTLIK